MGTLLKAALGVSLQLPIFEIRRGTSQMSSRDQITAFVDAISQRSAAKILEMGTRDASFLVELIGKPHSVSSVELHCTDSPHQAFDAEVLAAGEATSVEFQLTKHAGSDSEINETILELSSALAFDAIFVSSSASAEALLTSILVCNESLKVGGVFGLSSDLIAETSMSSAISSFKDLLGDSYTEISDHIFVKA